MKQYSKPEITAVEINTKETLLSYSDIHHGEESDGSTPMSLEPRDIWSQY